MKVWIDQDLCTGDGLCEEIAPDVFTLLDDGLAYVKEGDKVFSDPGGAEGLANVPAGQEEATIEAAEECPGECIFIEVDLAIGRPVGTTGRRAGPAGPRTSTEPTTAGRHHPARAVGPPGRPPRRSTGPRMPRPASRACGVRPGSPRCRAPG